VTSKPCSSSNSPRISDIVGGVSNTISTGSSDPSSRPSRLELQASNRNGPPELLQNSNSVKPQYSVCPVEIERNPLKQERNIFQSFESLEMRVNPMKTSERGLGE
jgi:hypothetical protein